jgi:hypothetical protein
MEKLGVEKKQLKEELQAEYNRVAKEIHTMVKEATPRRVFAANELDQIKQKLDELNGTDE